MEFSTNVGSDYLRWIGRTPRFSSFIGAVPLVGLRFRQGGAKDGRAGFVAGVGVVDGRAGCEAGVDVVEDGNARCLGVAPQLVVVCPAGVKHTARKQHIEKDTGKRV